MNCPYCNSTDTEDFCSYCGIHKPTLLASRYQLGAVIEVIKALSGYRLFDIYDLDGLTRAQMITEVAEQVNAPYP